MLPLMGRSRAVVKDEECKGDAIEWSEKAAIIVAFNMEDDAMII